MWPDSFLPWEKLKLYLTHTCPFPASEAVVKPKTEKDKLKELFPALCRADDPAPKVRFTIRFVGGIGSTLSLLEMIQSQIWESRHPAVPATTTMGRIHHSRREFNMKTINY